LPSYPPNFLPPDRFVVGRALADTAIRGRCNASDDYGDFYHDSTDIGDLSTYSWVAGATSFICFTPVTTVKEKMRHLAKIAAAA